MSAADLSNRLGKKGIDALINNVVLQSVDREPSQKIEPRLASIESRLLAIETRLEVADRLSNLEAEVSAPKASR